MSQLAPRDVLGFATSPRTWVVPVVFIVGLAVLLPSIYLAATVDPQAHLNSLRIGLVVEPQTVQQEPSAAASVAKAITDHIDARKVDLITLTSKDLAARMGEDSVAGSIVIPAGFDAAVATLRPAATTAVTIPEVRIRTNAGAGGINTGLVNGNLLPVLRAIATGLGEQRTASTGDLTPADAALLSVGFTVASAPYTDLPDHSGSGTSAFYYTLVIVLLGFIGASVVNPSIDSALGFAPTEIGPLVERRPYRAVTRFQTLVIKLAVITACAPLAAALVQLLAVTWIGLSVPDAVQLWAFASVSIASIGVGALAVFAIFGSGIGALINTTFYIALSMTSSGGTVPLAATPDFFRWFSLIAPFHGVLEGVRANLYFDANPAAGLTHGWISVLIGASIGLLLGLVATRLYDHRRGFERHPRPDTTADAAAEATAAR